MSYFVLDVVDVHRRVYINADENKTDDSKICIGFTYRELFRSGRGGRPPSGLNKTTVRAFDRPYVFLKFFSI